MLGPGLCVCVSADLCDDVREGVRAEFVVSVKGLRWTRNGISCMDGIKLYTEQ